MSTTTRLSGLIDTAVLIEYREGQPDAVAFILDIRQTGRKPAFSQLSAMSLFVWSRNAVERNGVEVFLKMSEIHPITAKIVRRAQAILESLTPPSPLSADDAIVAATAIEHKLPLYTLDPAKFAVVAGLSVLQPY